MQVVAFKTLDGKLFEHEVQQQEYDKGYLQDVLMSRLARYLMSAGLTNDSDPIDSVEQAKEALMMLFTSYGEEVLKAVQAYRKQSS